MDIIDLLKMMVERDASDLHLKVGSAPVLRIKRELVALDCAAPVSAEDTLRWANSFMNDYERAKFEKELEIDFAYAREGLGRFRVNIFRQKNFIGLVIRYVRDRIPSFAELNLPPALEKIASYERGLVLISGSSSSGKSTTLASIIDYINSRRCCHIITIEDPIEYIHDDKSALVNQREIGIDAASFGIALRHIIRQDPDIIAIGELRDAETFQVAVQAAETGHLVLTTLHAQDATQAIARVLDFFQSSMQEQVRNALSLNLRAVTSQRLLARADGAGIIPAVEIMLVNQTISNLVRENRLGKLMSAIQSAGDAGMQTFNQALVGLVKAKAITLDEALAKSTNPESLRMNLKGIYLDEDRSIIGE